MTRAFWTSLLLAGFFAVLAPSAASAEGLIDVRLIFAEKSTTPSVDAPLRDLTKTFARFPGYTKFSLIKQKELRLGKGKSQTVSAPNDKTVQVTYRGMSKGFVKLRFKLGELEMNVRVHNGGVFFHGGFNYKKGRVIVAIRAKGDPKDKVAP